jgi:hypothetical protein
MAVLIVTAPDPSAPLDVVLDLVDVDPAWLPLSNIIYSQVAPLPPHTWEVDPALVAQGNYALAVTLGGPTVNITYRMSALVYVGGSLRTALIYLYHLETPLPPEGITFTPPTMDEVPTNGSADESVVAGKLWQYYNPRPRGIAIFKMDDGSYWVSRFLPGVTGPVFREPWPPLPKADQANQTMHTTWLYSRVQADYPQVPGVVIVYYGGMSYPVSETEAYDLQAAGLGAYLS